MICGRASRVFESALVRRKENRHAVLVFALSMNADGNQSILHRSPLRTDKTDPTVLYLLNLMKARSYPPRLFAGRNA